MVRRKGRPVNVTYRDKVTPTLPIQNRTYTMTHSNETGELFVVIGLNYADDQTDEGQEQVYLKWVPLNGKWILYGEVLIDNEDFAGNKQIRYDIFKREMPLALQAIYVADAPFFEAHPELMDTPVVISFNSLDPIYDKLHSYGAIGDYTQISRHKPFH